MINAVLFVTLIVGGTALLAWPLGRYMTWAMDPPLRRRPDRWLDPRLPADRRTAGAGGAGLEAVHGRAAGCSTRSCSSVTFAILALQQYLPLNPDGMGPIAGRPRLQYHRVVHLQHQPPALFGRKHAQLLSQLGGLMWLQFVSAATGIAALAALARGLAGRETMGNFFVDLQRAAFLVLLPIALIVATLMVMGGMPMTFQGAAHATTLEGAEQVIARGPVAAFLDHQAARHQRRRLLRAELHASVREPELLDQRRWRWSAIILIPMAASGCSGGSSGACAMRRSCSA